MNDQTANNVATTQAGFNGWYQVLTGNWRLACEATSEADCWTALHERAPAGQSGLVVLPAGEYPPMPAIQQREPATKVRQRVLRGGLER